MGPSNLSMWLLKNSGKTKKYEQYDNMVNKICAEFFAEFESKYNILDSDDEFNYSACLGSWMKQYKDDKITKGEIISDIRTMFGAGIDTTARVTAKSLLYMVKYAGIQDKIYNELKEVVGDDEDNILKYIPRLHVLRACIHEFLRVQDKTGRAVIGSIPRTVLSNDVKINGYNIPKNAQLISFHTFIATNEKYWKTPESFDIDNFLEDGKFKKNAALSTFGYGRRSCPGLSLAKRMLYILVGKMVLNYKFNYGDKALDLTRGSSIVRTAEVFAEKR
eukprot:123688_1